MPKKPKCWSHAEGGKGTTVTVYERKPGGLLYARAFDPTLASGKGGYRRVSLNHRNQERAQTYALEQAARLRQGRNELADGKVTLAQVFALYGTHRTPRKSKSEQEADKRRANLWSRFLGPHKDPHVITRGEWERLVDLRSSGAINGLGSPVPEDKRRMVRDRTVQHDCLWLRWVLNWATTWQTPDGRYLMRENPVRGFQVPVEKNPRRPVVTTDRYEALRAVSDFVMMELRWGGKAQKQRSYLSELLDIAFGTGRRISAIRQLRYEDLRLDVKLFGAIRWPEDTDKTGRETVAPITATVRAAVDRVLAERPGIGAAYLFPSPMKQSAPIRYELASEWLVEAERVAELPKQSGSLWHAYRRGWVTARKHLPDVDVAAAGGWKDVRMLKECYQQPDLETMLEVVQGGRELKERHA